MTKRIRQAYRVRPYGSLWEAVRYDGVRWVKLVGRYSDKVGARIACCKTADELGEEAVFPGELAFDRPLGVRQ